MGLVNKITPPDKTIPEAKALAREIASKPPVAVRQAKAAILKSFEAPLETSLQHERDLFYSLFDTADQKEGMASFLEKRTPQWTGR